MRNQPRILLVEDEPTIAVTLSDDLQDHGYDVVHTDNGSEAVQWIQRHRFDAVVTDLRLPGADGLQVVRAVRRALPGAPVLVVSAHLEAHGDRALREGATKVLVKPFDNRAVVEWLHEAVSTASAD